MTRNNLVLISIPILFTIVMGTILSYVFSAYGVNGMPSNFYDGVNEGIANALNIEPYYSPYVLIAAFGLVCGLGLAAYEGSYIKYRHYMAKNNVDVPFDSRYYIPIAIAAVLCLITLLACVRSGILDVMLPYDVSNGSESSFIKSFLPFLETLIATVGEALVVIRTANRHTELYIKDQEKKEKILLGK